MLHQAKETSAADSSKETQSCGTAECKDKTNERSDQNLGAEAEAIPNTQLQDVSQDDTGDENESQSEQKLHLEDKLEGSVSGDPGITAQEPSNGIKSEDSPNGETSVTVPADSPSSSEEVA